MVFPVISEQDKNFLVVIFNNSFKEIKNNFFISSLIHQDFNVSNILVNPETFKLTGIIDFDDMDIGDVVCDLALINQDFKFYKVMLDGYKS